MPGLPLGQPPYADSPLGLERQFVGPSVLTAPVVVPGIPVVVPTLGAPDLVTQARSRLIQQYRGKPKMTAMVEALAYLFQDIVNAAMIIPLLDDFNQAAGVNLDATAAYIGQSRTIAGFTTVSDDFLRILSQLRIIRNHSSGTGPEIIAAVAALLGNDGTQINYLSAGRMYVDVQVQRQPTVLEAAAVDSDLLPRPIGVDMVVSWFLVTRHFGWDEDVSAGALGFSEEGDDTKGGCFAEIF